MDCLLAMSLFDVLWWKDDVLQCGVNLKLMTEVLLVSVLFEAVIVGVKGHSLYRDIIFCIILLTTIQAVALSAL